MLLPSVQIIKYPQVNGNKLNQKKKALPRIELGLLDSKSNVLTITP